MNVLFVCSRNRWRSLTAEHIYKNHPDHEIRSVGTEPSARVKMNANHFIWADLIFVMEKKHKQRIRERFLNEIIDKEIVILDIPDEYRFMDEDLIKELNMATADYF